MARSGFRSRIRPAGNHLSQRATRFPVRRARSRPPMAARSTSRSPSLSGGETLTETSVSLRLGETAKQKDPWSSISRVTPPGLGFHNGAFDLDGDGTVEHLAYAVAGAVSRPSTATATAPSITAASSSRSRQRRFSPNSPPSMRTGAWMRRERPAVCPMRWNPRRPGRTSPSPQAGIGALAQPRCNPFDLCRATLLSWDRYAVRGIALRESGEAGNNHIDRTA